MVNQITSQIAKVDSVIMALAKLIRCIIMVVVVMAVYVCVCTYTQGGVGESRTPSPMELGPSLMGMGMLSDEGQ